MPAPLSSTSTARGGVAASFADLPCAMMTAAATTAAVVTPAFIMPPSFAAASTTTPDVSAVVEPSNVVTANHGPVRHAARFEQQSASHEAMRALQPEQSQPLVTTTTTTNDWWPPSTFTHFSYPYLNFLVPDAVLAPRFSLRQTLQVSSKIDNPLVVYGASASTETTSTTATTTRSSSSSTSWKRPAVVGHRGALYDALENTRPAFQRCVDLSCQAVELDVFLLERTSDHDPTPVLVVFHGSGTDDNPGLLDEYCVLPTTTAVAARSIVDLTYEETQQLQFNTKNAEFPCPIDQIVTARIPTLREVLQDLKDTGVHIKIELKGGGRHDNNNNAVVPAVVELVEQMQMTHVCSYSSFDHAKLQYLRELRPDAVQYPTGALFDHSVPDDFVAQAQQCGATAVHVPYDACTVDRVAQIRAAGMQSMAWFRGPVGMAADTTTKMMMSDRMTSSLPFNRKYWDVGNEDEACYRAVLDTGVDEMCVNRPDVLLNFLDRLEQEHRQQQQNNQQQLPRVVSLE